MLPNTSVKDSQSLDMVQLKRKASQDAVPETVAAETVKVEKVAESADHGGNGANELPYGHWRGRPRDSNSTRENQQKICK